MPIFVYLALPNSRNIVECVIYTPPHPTPVGVGNVVMLQYMIDVSKMC